MGSSAKELPATNKMNMKGGPTLTHHHKLALIAPVSEEEIQQGLDSIGEDKAPGIDRYNANFFRKAWGTIKEEVREAVKEFFTTGKLYNAINCTTIILLPKNDKPRTLMKYRPIACCTVMYKLISKVIAARIQIVIASIISESQA
ncbi:PREDICTED: uncharacterized protein LOC109214834 [Nicotiana attenuata]|uniref:uncharacterized protein LOC109214834 n=1 Tax=Nicotiana attenuata TaxID=49451 RepID=UPI00090569B4|nr:PREDICTED: uncharacterized protein LOC109214834 [Nicotiana attenuata]